MLPLACAAACLAVFLEVSPAAFLSLGVVVTAAALAQRALERPGAADRSAVLFASAVLAAAASGAASRARGFASGAARTQVLAPDAGLGWYVAMTTFDRFAGYFRLLSAAYAAVVGGAVCFALLAEGGRPSGDLPRGEEVHAPSRASRRASWKCRARAAHLRRTGFHALLACPLLACAVPLCASGPSLRLWLVTGTGNANHYFFQTVVFAAALCVLLSAKPPAPPPPRSCLPRPERAT